jgi:hypothetical protein
VKLKEDVRGWERTSPLVGNHIFEISGHNDSIATKELEAVGGGRCNKCLFADGLAMQECAGKHRMSIKVVRNNDEVSAFVTCV